MLRTAHIDDIFVPQDRVRKDFTPAAIEELKEDILANSLLHPVVVYATPSPTTLAPSINDVLPMFTLVAGERRLRALRSIYEDALGVTYGTKEFDPGFIPVTVIDYRDAGSLLEIELNENLKRQNISWQEEVDGIRRLHELRMSQNPMHTRRATALEVVSGTDNAPIITAITKSLLLASNLDDPRVASAKTRGEAWTYLNTKMQAVHSDLLRQYYVPSTEGTTPNKPFSSKPPINHTLYEGPFQSFADDLRGKFSCVLADPPYGIDADKMSRQKTAHHYYEDSELTALETAKDLCTHAYSWLEDSGCLFMFCAPNLWHRMDEFARDAGFSTWPRPVIWRKSREGLRPWGTRGFAYTYEAILFACKGRRGLLATDCDVLDFARSPRGKLHGAQKPVSLYKHLLSLACLPGESVIDPTCGSGTIFPAASALGLFATGLEIDPHYQTIARERMYSTEAEEVEDEDLENV